MKNGSMLTHKYVINKILQQSNNNLSMQIFQKLKQIYTQEKII